MPSAARPAHVYVHVPFCARRCTYCDFAIAVRARVPVDEYLDALGAELRARHPEAWDAPGDWVADTLYVGGGTPSRLGGEGGARLVELLRRVLTLAPGAEVTFEANPDDVTPDAVASWRDAGVNRLSLGGQTFDDAALQWMHRSHGAAQIERAVDVARAGGIENLSLDLIFALPDGVSRSWDRDLERALALEPSHLSLYGLTVESGTPLGRRHERGEVAEADEDRYATEFLRAHERLACAGYEHYEVSNFARDCRRSRHNSSYWSGVPYAGLGPSAHGFDGVTRRWNEASYAAWVARAGAVGDPVAGSERLDADAVEAERVYLGLRTIDGLALRDGEAERVRSWVDAGWGAVDGDRLRLTPLGWLRLDALAADLTLFRSRS